MIITPGTTNVTIEITVVDDDGLPVTGLVAATMPSIYYSRAGETLPSAISLSDLAAQNSTHSDGGVKELAVGRYRLDLPDAACATATRLYVFGETTDKRVICEPITVAHIASNVTQFGGSDGTFSSGRPEVNATHWGGTAVGSATVRSDLINIAGSPVDSSSAQLGVNVVNAAGTAWNSGAIGASTLATGTITATKFAASAITSGVLETGALSGQSVLSVTNAVTVGTNNDKTGYSMAGTITSLDALDAAQDTQHGITQSAIGALNNLSSSDVKTQADAALSDIHLDHLLAVDYDPSSKPGVSTALLNELIGSDAGVSQFTANALELAPSGGGGGGDATEANQVTIIGHLTDIKGTGWGSTDNLAEIAEDVAGLNGDAMRGTDSANTTTPLDAAGIRSAMGLASANLDTQLGDIPTVAEFEARTLTADSYFDSSTDTVVVGTNNDKTGYSLSSSAIQAIYDFATASIAASGSFGKYVLDSIATLLTRLSSSRADYLDNLNVGGAVASQADINALNQSASRRVLLVTVGQYERPEASSVTYTIEARTFDADGAAVDADSTPTLTGTGSVTGSLAANIGTVSNPSTGVYRWQYTVASGHNQEQIRFDLSATISSSTFTLSTYTQVVDLVAATWTTADESKLTAIYDKLPSTDYLLGSGNPDGSGYSTHAESDVVTAINANATQVTLQTNAANAASSAATAATQATTAATQATAANGIVSSGTHGNAALKALIDTNNTTTAKLATMIESDGAGGWRYTAGSLSQAGEVTPGDTTLIAYVSAVGVVGQAASSSGTLTIVRYSDFSVLLTGLGSLAGRDAVVFTLKSAVTDTDEQALIQIVEDTGATIFKGAAAGDASIASITVVDENTGSVRIRITNAATALFTDAEQCPYSVKVIDADGDTVELTNVDWQSSLTYARIITGITRAVE